LSLPPSAPETILTRVVLFTGKGGVGKTSIAAATAVEAASRGARVLVTSTDPAHSLADAFATPLADRPTPIEVGRAELHAQQLDAQQRLERHWGRIRDYLTALLHWGGIGDVAAEELVLLPGLDELFALIDLRAQVATGAYDLVVVDCAPTAETLKLLTLPDALRFYTDRVLSPGRALARAVAPLTRYRGPSGAVLPVPDDRVVDAVTDVHGELAGVHALLTDTDRSSVRLVVNPERIVLAEAERTATSLSLFGYGVDAVIVNRILPDHLDHPYLARWRQRHAEHLAAARTAFAPTPVLEVPLLEDEVIGGDALGRLGRLVYADHDPIAVLHPQRPLTIVEDGDATLLVLALPFAVEDDLSLSRRDDDLQVSVGGLRRNIPLPAALRLRAIIGARLDGGALEVRFAAAEVPVVSR
jgi:arsenite/tail-anchored protein-transporting ATPase